MATDVEEVRDTSVRLSTDDGQQTAVEADQVFAMIGREAPLDFFRRSGITIRNDWGETPDSWTDAFSGLAWLKDLNWGRIGAFAAFFLFMCAVYSWKDGGWLNRVASSANLFPFNLDPRPGATSLWDVIYTSATKPGFYYTFAYSAIVVIFGVKRIRRRKTPYVKVQTLTLMAIQVLPLFVLPEVILPYLGANGWLPTGFLDALFPTSEYAVHGREYWRAYGFILAWPLLVYNVFTSDPLWWWIGICFVQTFVLIPGMIYYWGKGAYCGWICSCGALAETLGDQHRDKMPHGEGWNKLNLAGQVILGLAFAALFLRIGAWAAPNTWMQTAYQGLMYGQIAGLKINYAWLVDVVLAGMIGYGVYFWLSGRFWCRFFCPLAALMHIYHRFSRFRILADKKKCISCNVCTSVCHQGIDVMSFAQQGKPMEDPECVRCSACVQSCPTGVLEFGQVDNQTGQIVHRDDLVASLTHLEDADGLDETDRQEAQAVA
jgi:ferredoxin